MDFYQDAWNNLTGPTTVPTTDEPSYVDSSGNYASGLNMGNMLKGGGSIFSAFGDIMAGDQANQAYQYNAQLALEQEGFSIDKLDKAEVGMLSTQRAMYAKAGVAMTGSPFDVALKTATNFEMDKQITRYNAQSKANMDVYQGQVAKSQGEMKAAGDLLSGAAQIGASMA